MAEHGQELSTAAAVPPPAAGTGCAALAAQRLAVMTLLTTEWRHGGVALANTLRAVRRESGVSFDMVAVCADFEFDRPLLQAGWTCVRHQRIAGITAGGSTTC